MDYGALGPPTLQIWSPYARRTGARKYAVNRAGGHLRSTLGQPRSFKKLFPKKLLNLKPFCLARFALTRGGHGTL